MSREPKTLAGDFLKAKQRHRANQNVVDAARETAADGQPRWVNLGPARLLLGPYPKDENVEFPFEDLLFVLKGRLYAATCAGRNGSSDQRACAPLSGAPCPQGVHTTNLKVLARILDHHPRKQVRF